MVGYTWRLARPLILFAAIIAASAGHAAGMAPFRIHRIEYQINSEAVIGPVRAGMLCLPSGKIRWGDLRLPGELDGQAIIADSLSRAGLKILESEADRAGAAAVQVNLTVEAAQLRLCVPGIARVMGKPKGQGNIRLRWQVSSADGGAPITALVSDVALDPAGEDPRRVGGMIERALAEGASHFARRWAAQQSHLLP